jgi:hypothetical protein
MKFEFILISLASLSLQITVTNLRGARTTVLGGENPNMNLGVNVYPTNEESRFINTANLGT